MVVPGPENPGDPIQFDVNDIQVDVNVIHETMHSHERWLGAHGSPTATRFADVTETAFQIDSGNTVFGVWVQVLGTDDTPLDSGKGSYQWDQILITDLEQTTTYRIQIAFGPDADAALTAGHYTEMLVRKGPGLVEPFPVDFHNDIHDAGEEAWARCRCASNTGTVDFMIGLHEYDS